MSPPNLGGRPMIVDHELIIRVEDAMATERSAFADGMSALQPGSAGRAAYSSSAMSFKNASGVRRSWSRSSFTYARLSTGSGFHIPNPRSSGGMAWAK